MLYLFLSICFTTLIFITFRIFGRFQVHTFKAIVVNYGVCVLLGLISLPESPRKILQVLTSEFYLIGGIMGILFVANFYMMGRATQLFGVAPATICARMSLVIPAFYSIWRYQEVFNWQKGVGVLLALTAIVLTLYPEKEATKAKLTAPHSSVDYLFPVAAFLGTGIIDSLFKTVQVNFLEGISPITFQVMLFGSAGIAGILALGVQKGKQWLKYGKQTLIAGIGLGLVNFFAIFFLLKALSTGNLDGSVLFPINSVSIVALSTLISYLLFKERLNMLNKIGFVFSIAAILLISFS